METTVKTVLKDLGINEKRAIRDYAMLNASQKATEFTQECEAFERKYKMSFQDFEKQIKESTKEIFEKEDDYLAWKFSFEGADYWREKVEQLKHES